MARRQLEDGDLGAPSLVDTVHRVETPENVSLAFRTAGLWARGLAFAFDTLLILVVLFLVGMAVGGTSWGQRKLAEGELVWLFPFLTFTMQAGYFLLFEAFTSGLTPGKHLLRLRVVKIEGQPIGFYDSMLRNLLRVVDALPMFFLITSHASAVISMVFTRRSQRLGDLAAGTIVIHEGRSSVRRHLSATDSVESFRREDWNGSFRPSERTLTTIDTFLRRRPRIRASRADEVARILAVPLAHRLGFTHPDLDPEKSPIVFLLRVLRTFSEESSAARGSDPSERRSTPFGAKR